MTQVSSKTLFHQNRRLKIKHYPPERKLSLSLIPASHECFDQIVIRWHSLYLISTLLWKMKRVTMRERCHFATGHTWGKENPRLSFSMWRSPVLGISREPAGPAWETEEVVRKECLNESGWTERSLCPRSCWLPCMWQWKTPYKVTLSGSSPPRWQIRSSQWCRISCLSFGSICIFFTWLSVNMLL